MLIRLRGYYAPEKKVLAPADSKSVRLTQVFDAEQLKTRMTVVELLQVMNDESNPVSVRFEATKAALPFCHRPKDEISNDDDSRRSEGPCRATSPPYRSCSAGAIRARPCSPERSSLVKAPCQAPQPPSPCCGVRAATGPTIRSKSAFEPGLPWIGTCCATSSFRRLRLRYNTTALLFTFAKLPPAGGGP
jgi:hypothetical protein